MPSYHLSTGRGRHLDAWTSQPAAMAAGWVSWPWQGQRIITGVLDRRRPAAASGIGMHGACGVSAQGWLSGPLLGCTGRDPLCPASRRQRQIEDNPQRPHAACTVAPPQRPARRGRRRLQQGPMPQQTLALYILLRAWWGQ